MSIQKNLHNILQSIPEGVKLIAVTKTHSIETIMEVYNCGHKIFGENKVQELVSKHKLLPNDIEWHFIGHLQSNKVKYIAPFISLIHSVDSIKLLVEIDKQANKNNRIIDVLLEFHIAEEESKHGLKKEDIKEIFESELFQKLNNVRIIGVMCMATFTNDEQTIRKEFKELKYIFDFIKHKYFNLQYFKEISMGMSNDYEIAIEEGATIIRIGSNIFGSR